MGKLVTFWSPVSGQAKTTASMIAVASALALAHPSYDIAITTVAKDETSLEDGLAAQQKWIGSEKLYGQSGISALLLACKQEILTREKIRRCALPLILPEAVLFPGLRQEISIIHGREPEKLEHHILNDCIRTEFGITFLDLKAGFSMQSLRYMECADLSVVVLPQNPNIWKVFLEQKEKIRTNQWFVLFGGYLKNSKYNVHCYKRNRYGIPGSKNGVIPLCEGYMDAFADGKAMEFFLKNEFAGKKDENYEFMEKVKKAAKGISDGIFLS